MSRKRGFIHDPCPWHDEKVQAAFFVGTLFHPGACLAQQRAHPVEHIAWICLFVESLIIQPRNAPVSDFGIWNIMVIPAGYDEIVKIFQAWRRRAVEKFPVFVERRLVIEPGIPVGTCGQVMRIIVVPAEINAWEDGVIADAGCHSAQVFAFKAAPDRMGDAALHIVGGIIRIRGDFFRDFSVP